MSRHVRFKNKPFQEYYSIGGCNMKKKKSLLVILIAALFTIISYQSLLAAEKTVMLTVPGCV
jgi:hypothetical protein